MSANNRSHYKLLVKAIATESDDVKSVDVPTNKTSLAAFLEAAIVNDVFYSAYRWVIENRGSSALKQETPMKRYEGLYYQYITGQLVQRSEATHLLKSFAERGIRVMPLKGLFLSSQYYKEPLARYSSDIDLLFESKSDRVSAETILVENGYSVSNALPLEKQFTKRISRVSAHFETHNCPISLTYLFEYPRWYDLWPRSTAGRILGSPARLMCPEDALLLLCAHVLRTGTLSVRDFMDFLHIRDKLDNHSWNFLKQVSGPQIWRYIIAVPLVIFFTLGIIFLSKQLLPRELIYYFAAETNIRIEDSNKLVRFIVREYGTPIDLRLVMRYFGYTGTPLFEKCILWNRGLGLSSFRRVQTVLLEGYQTLSQGASRLNHRNAKDSISSYLSAYTLHFRYRHSEPPHPPNRRAHGSAFERLTDRLTNRQTNQLENES